LPDLVLRHILQRQRLALSAEVWAEYVDVLHRAKFQRIAGFTQAAETLLIDIASAGLWFTPRSIITAVQDPADNKFLELAIEAKADLLLTGNTRDFDFQEFRGIAIITLRTYTDLYMGET